MSQFQDTRVLESPVDFRVFSASEGPPLDLFDDPTEDLTLVEVVNPKSKSQKLYAFLRYPYFSKTLSLVLVQYFKEVRQRMVESRDFDRVHYSHTVYQRVRRLLYACYLHMKKNLQA